MGFNSVFKALNASLRSNSLAEVAGAIKWMWAHFEKNIWSKTNARSLLVISLNMLKAKLHVFESHKNLQCEYHTQTLNASLPWAESELVGSVESMEHSWNCNCQEQTEVVEEELLPVLLIPNAYLLLMICLETGDPWCKEKNWANIAYCLYFWHCIQSDLGGNVNILGGYSIGHCEKIKLMHCGRVTQILRF